MLPLLVDCPKMTADIIISLVTTARIRPPLTLFLPCHSKWSDCAIKNVGHAWAAAAVVRFSSTSS